MQISTAALCENVLSAPSPGRSRLVMKYARPGIIVLAIVLRLAFWYYTERTWEDALITVQHAENAARGLGLTHTPQAGPALHGFTSPLSVLIPLIGELIHAGLGLPFLRILSAMFGGLSAWLGMKIASRLGLNDALILLVGGYLAVEHHQILWGMAGMESQIAVAILLFSIYTLFDLQPRRVGLGIGLCMLVRPDFLFWVVIVLLVLANRCLRNRNWRPLVVALAVSAVVYGPWVVFTTAYYGSVIPNTILAKGYGYPSFHNWSSTSAFWYIWARLWFRIFASLGPAYGGNGNAFQLLPGNGFIVGTMLAIACFSLPFARERRNAAGAGVCGFVLVYVSYYLFAVPQMFGWYIVPVTAVTIIAVAMGTEYLISRTSSHRVTVVTSCGVGLYLSMMTVFSISLMGAERRVQEIVDDGNRKQIGLFLGSVMRPDETVGCEPLGYIGYYSRRIVYDFPGLCNRSVTRFMREHPQHHTLSDMLAAFRPDYLVLRPGEVQAASASGQWLRQDYQFLREFHVPDEASRKLLFSESNVDKVFIVYKKRASPAASSAALR